VKISPTYVNLWFSFWHKGEDMRGDRFWKIIVTLCLTFWLGTFTAGLFVSTDKPSKESVIAEKRNCVPVDKNLKYQLLGETVSVNEKQTEKQKTNELEKALERVEKKDEVLYRPDKDRFEYEILLHKEHCYESEK
jgi:hypothetical protein